MKPHGPQDLADDFEKPNVSRRGYSSSVEHVGLARLLGK